MNKILIVFGGLLLGIILDYLLAFIFNKHFKKGFSLFGIRIHHTVWGLFLIIIGLFFYPWFFISMGIAIILRISIGIGIILSHTLRTKEFVFIERRKK